MWKNETMIADTNDLLQILNIINVKRAMTEPYKNAVILPGIAAVSFTLMFGQISESVFVQK